MADINSLHGRNEIRSTIGVIDTPQILKLYYTTI